MSKKRILIYDDDPTVAKKWMKRLEKTLRPLRDQFDVAFLDLEDFKKCMIEIEKRRRSSRKENGLEAEVPEIAFDDADILIIDYNLFNPEAPDSGDFSFISGEEVAYFARCYTRCRLIIGLNQFGENSFDLTLKGHPESYADLNIGGEQIDNKGLWFDAPWQGFRPWYWPVLPHAREAFEKRVDELKARDNLDKAILDFLELEDVAQILPRSSLEFISRKNPEETTFREFVQDSGNGLDRKDRPLDDGIIARIAAARIGKWLERLVLPGQDILVDAPHLVLRYPSLLQGNKENRKDWDKITAITEYEKLGIDLEKLEAFRFQKDNWLSRPAWFWHHVSNSEKIEEVKNPWATDRLDLVFSEDVSSFRPKHEAREFVADVPSPFVRRFVKIAKRVTYEPNVRFSL